MEAWIGFPGAARIPGLRAFTSTRSHNLGLNTAADPAEVLAARGEAWSRIQVPLDCSVFLQQVHGARLEAVGASARGRGSRSLEDALPGCDAAVSEEPGTFLCVGHADCLAVLLADPRRRAVAAAHCGWRGAAAGIAGKAARALIQGGSRPEDLWAGLSVCLGPCHLELSEKEHPHFPHRPLKNGHFMLDLWAEASRQLRDEGLRHIEYQRICTACNLERFFSYRAEQGKTGRMISLVGFSI